MNKMRWGRLLFGFCVASMLSACVSTTTENGQQVQPTAVRLQSAAMYNVQLGVRYAQQGEMERAKMKLLLALKQAPDWAPAFDAMAYYQDLVGNEAIADDYYRKALAIAPHSGSSLNNYGVFLCRHKHYQAAVTQFVKAVSDPNYLSTAQAYENAGLCAMAIPELSQAAGFFQKALLNDPQMVMPLLELADIRYQQGQYGEAQNYLSRFQAEGQQNARSLWLGIRIAQKLGQAMQVTRGMALLREKFPASSEYKAATSVN